MFFFLYLLIRQPRPAPHTLSLHDALPISFDAGGGGWGGTKPTGRGEAVVGVGRVGVCGTVDGTVGFWELVTTEVALDGLAARDDGGVVGRLATVVDEIGEIPEVWRTRVGPS